MKEGNWTLKSNKLVLPTFSQLDNHRLLSCKVSLIAWYFRSIRNRSITGNFINLLKSQTYTQNENKIID